MLLVFHFRSQYRFYRNEDRRFLGEEDRVKEKESIDFQEKEEGKMSSSNEIEARLDAVQDSVAGSLQKSYHGIAARLDRIPAGKALRIIL